METIQDAMKAYNEYCHLIVLADYSNPVINRFMRLSSVTVTFQKEKVRVAPNSAVMTAREAGRIIYRLANPKTGKGNTPRTGAILCWSEPKAGSNAGEVRHAQALTIDMQRDILGTVAERLAFWNCFETGEVCEEFWQGDETRPSIWSQIRNKTGLDIDRRLVENRIPDAYDCAASIIDEIDVERIAERHAELHTIAKRAHQRDNSREKEANWTRAKDLIDLAFAEKMGWNAGWVEWRDHKGKQAFFRSATSRSKTLATFQAYMAMGA